MSRLVSLVVIPNPVGERSAFCLREISGIRVANGGTAIPCSGGGARRRNGLTLISTNPKRSSNAAQGPIFPSFSILPAHTRQLIGCISSMPATNPTHIKATERTVSSEMSEGSAFVDEFEEGIDKVGDVAEAWVMREECSYAE